jgi:hypothetical protein
LILSNDNDESSSSGNGNYNSSFLSRLAKSGIKNLEDLQMGDVVVAKKDVPSLRIWRGLGYEIIAIYLKGVNRETGLVEEIPLETFYGVVSSEASEATRAPKDVFSKSPVGYTKYLKVYNPRNHADCGPVVVSPEEIGLVTLKSELTQAILLAIPGFFWVFVAAAFSSYYNDQYGGNFWNALFGT